MDTIKNNKNILIFIAIIFLVGVIIGYYSKSFIGFSKLSTVNKSCSAELKEIFSGVPLNSFSGKVTVISPKNNFLTVKVDSFYGFNIPEKYQTKKILINKNTKIILQTNKTQAILEKELSIFKEKNKQRKDQNISSTTQGSLVSPPLPYIEKEINLKEIKTGDRAIIMPNIQNKSDILDRKFTAKEIIIKR